MHEDGTVSFVYLMGSNFDILCSVAIYFYNFNVVRFYNISIWLLKKIRVIIVRARDGLPSAELRDSTV